ncbi:MAG TPA: hypothetical protein VD813_09715 [Pseudonocardia sp.]|nr:hypothetical protein [Pseudonocardia sp.]
MTAPKDGATRNGASRTGAPDAPAESGAGVPTIAIEVPAATGGAAGPAPGGVALPQRQAPPAGGTPAAAGASPDHDERAGLPPPGSLTVREAVRLALLALVIVIGAGGLGYDVSLLFPTQYAARAEVLYPISIEQPTGFLREDRNLTTQLVLIQSRSTLEPVAAAEGIPVEELQRKLSAEVVETSEIIQVEVRDPSRERGVELADGVVRSYLDTATGRRPDPVRAFVQGELDRTREELAGNPPDRDALVQREQALVAQLDNLTTAELSRPVPSLLVPPYSAPDPVGVGPLTTTAVGMLLGLLVAAPLVLVLARRRTRRRTGG